MIELTVICPNFQANNRSIESLEADFTATKNQWVNMCTLFAIARVIK
jgi:hypothetical protein